MDFEGFVKFDFLISYVGMITVVMLLTNFTKNIFDKICYNSTKYVAYGFSFGLCTLAALYLGTWTGAGDIVQTIVVWLVNSVIVWFAAIKAYDAIPKK